MNQPPEGRKKNRKNRKKEKAIEVTSRRGKRPGERKLGPR
jgi:hypothetical protein